LADADRPADQPRVGDAAAAVLVEQGLLGLDVAEQRERVAWVPDLDRFGLGSGRAHTCRSSNEIGACAGSSRELTAAQMSSATWSTVRSASISTQRCGSAAAIRRNAWRRLVWNSIVSVSKRSACPPA